MTIFTEVQHKKVKASNTLSITGFFYSLPPYILAILFRK